MAGNVLSIISGRELRASWDPLLRVASETLRKLGLDVAAPVWLAPDRAVDLPFGEGERSVALSAVQEAIRREFGALSVDLVAQPRAGRRKRLLVADMESTVIANEMLEELADILRLGPHIAELTRRAMNGELDFAAALRERVTLLRGAPATVLAEAAGRIRITPGARPLVATMRAHGAYTALVSSGFRVFTAGVSAELGFDIDFANELEIAGSKLAGTVREPILGRDAKLAALRRLAAERCLSLAETVTVGDGANDVPMLMAAGLGIAFHAKPSVLAQAPHRIEHGDLRALLYVQGYREDEIVEGAG